MVQGTEAGIVKHIEIPEAHIKVRSDGIIHVHYKKDTVLDVELQERMRLIYVDLLGDRKAKFIFSADEGFMLTKEAKENSQRLEHMSRVSHYALIAPSLGYRIIVNFYFKVVRPRAPYKICCTLDDAAAWLNNQ